MQDTVTVRCPYCGQPNEIYLDYASGRLQKYVEDCQVCCRPWDVQVDLSTDEPVVSVSSQEE